MNYGINREPEVLPQFNLKYVDHHGLFYYTSKLYLAYFGKLGSIYKYSEIDIPWLLEDFPKEFNEEILGQHRITELKQKEEIDQQIYILREEIMINITKDGAAIFYGNESATLFKKVMNFFLRLKIEKPDKAHINLIIMQPHGFDNKKINFNKPDLDLSRSYNDDFQIFNNKILKILQEENKSGLHLLYGKPGTGKSTYIRYLCGLVKKEIVFLPGQMAQNLDNIAMTKYLMDHPNSILVIEDAEELIVSRDTQRNSNLAMILNITDGILGESLGIQIIATFNTDVQNIDPALKRKGRLKSAYEFKALSSEKANGLLREQNSDFSTNDEMTLAEIFNISEEEQYKSPVRKAVGFR